MLKRPAFLTVAVALFAAPVFAAVDFEKDVKPILETNCVRCHNPTGQAQKASDCMVCHTYHSPDQVAAPLTASSVSFKQMLFPK